MVVPDIHNQTVGFLHLWENFLEVFDHLVRLKARQIDVQRCRFQFTTLEDLGSRFLRIKTSRQGHFALGSVQALDAQNGLGTVFTQQKPRSKLSHPGLVAWKR